MTEPEYSLAKSKKALGPLYPILKDKFGNIIDGFHRQNDDPDWEPLTRDQIDTPVKLELARLAANFCRRQMPAVEIENRIAFLVKNGLKVAEIAEQTGISEGTIYRHMPQELKNPVKVEAGKISGSVRTCEQTVKTQERRTLEHCEGCKTSQPNVSTWHGRLRLCPDCIKKANGNPEVFEHAASVKNGQAKMLAKAPEAKPLMPMQMTRYGDRVEMMKVQHGAMENKIVQKLRDKGYKVSTGQKIVVYEVTTEPDWNIELSSGRMARGFVDHEFTHGAKQMDRDEELRGLLRKLEPTSLIIGVRVKGDSDREADEKVAEIVEEMKF